jgi:hypothetical protein
MRGMRPCCPKQSFKLRELIGLIFLFLVAPIVLLGCHGKKKSSRIPQEIKGSNSLSLAVVGFFDEEDGEKLPGFFRGVPHKELLPLTLEVLPLAGQGELSFFWQRKIHEIITVLKSPEDLIDSGEGISGQGELKDRFWGSKVKRTLETGSGNLGVEVIGNYPVELTFSIKKMEFFSDESSLLAGSQGALSPGVFGPFKWRIRLFRQGAASSPIYTWQQGGNGEMSPYSWLEDERGQKVTQIMLPRGIYRNVRLTWGGLAQVKGCALNSGELYCTHPNLSPMNKTSLLKEFSAPNPPVTDLPLVNESVDWPLGGDFVEDYPVSLDLPHQTKMTLVYSLPHLVSFYRPDVQAHDLGGFIPRKRPYFYLSGHRDRIAITDRALGRLYEFMGNAMLCYSQSGKDCEVSGGRPSHGPKSRASSLQILVDGTGRVDQVFWHGPFGSYRGDMKTAEFVPRDKRKNENILTAADSENSLDSSDLVEMTFSSLSSSGGSDPGEIPPKLKLRGLPFVVDSWLRGQVKSLEIVSIGACLECDQGAIGLPQEREKPSTLQGSPIISSRLELTRVL